VPTTSLIISSRRSPRAAARPPPPRHPSSSPGSPALAPVVVHATETETYACRSSSNISPAPTRRSPTLASPAEAPAAPSVRPHRQPTRSASFQAPPAHDPFLVSSATTENAKDAVPLSPRPTGKLARRRRQAPDSPTPARAVAVPRAEHQSRHSMSRSVPDTVNFGARPAPRRTNTQEVPVDLFPVCDDLSDAEDTSAVLFPATPKKTNPLVHFDAPRTAPLCAPSTPIGVFDMSSDEDVGSPRDELIFGLTPLSAKGSPAAHRKTREQQRKADFFANSEFQNSPDPDELPVPDF
jgi:hypothetical protein